MVHIAVAEQCDVMDCKRTTDGQRHNCTCLTANKNGTQIEKEVANVCKNQSSSMFAPKSELAWTEFMNGMNQSYDFYIGIY